MLVVNHETSAPNFSFKLNDPCFKASDVARDVIVAMATSVCAQDQNLGAKMSSIHRL